jgi:hypothetical protein
MTAAAAGHRTDSHRLAALAVAFAP